MRCRARGAQATAAAGERQRRDVCVSARGAASLARAFRTPPTRPVILRTERLVLREFVPGDWEATHAYQNDPRYLRYYEREGVTRSKARAFVEAFVLFQAEPRRSKVQLAVTLAEGGALIGNAGLRRDHADEPVADVGYELDPRHWGRGYATEAVRALLDWGFGGWGLERVHAHCIAENAASAAVLRRAGFREEARLRDHERFKGRCWDVLLFGILREEWAAAADRHASSETVP
jgi:[ribosomal protein S5]-alanine N-acetyltransferase